MAPDTEEQDKEETQLSTPQWFAKLATPKNIFLAVIFCVSGAFTSGRIVNNYGNKIDQLTISQNEMSRKMDKIMDRMDRKDEQDAKFKAEMTGSFNQLSTRVDVLETRLNYFEGKRK